MAPPRLGFVAALLAARAAARPPSILFLMPDQWRGDWDGFARPHEDRPALRMPNLAALAASGARVEQAYVQAPVCAPSRSCMASLRDYDAAGTATNGANDYDLSIPTYFQLLRDEGHYHTMTTGKDDLTKVSQLGYHLGYDTRNASDTYHATELGFADSIRYSGKQDVLQSYPAPHEGYGYMLNGSTVALENGTTVDAYAAHASCLAPALAPGLCDASSFPQELYEDDWTAANAVELIQRAPDDRPFFLWVSFPGPHSPFTTTASMHASTEDRAWPSAVDSNTTINCDVGGGVGLNRTRCNYAAEVEHLDELFGDVLAAARAKDPNLIACAFSDHGEMLDDHNDQDKSKPWQGALAVPLVCAGPGIKAGLTLPGPAAIFDLGATALDWAGVAPPPETTAVSMRGLLAGAPTSNRSVVLSGLQSDVWGANQTWSFRLAVARTNGTVFKYVCCVGACPGSPSTASPADADGYTRLLFDTVNDPFDMHDVKAAYPDVAEALRRELPVVHGFECGAPPGRR
mmetsp:Transcript_18209/g.54136  ORF Transcript_18209/g.54136 Transcript_18209/m.54136 type:complete len:517 (+) Transcript_18209:253-1803(+)